MMNANSSSRSGAPEPSLTRPSPEYRASNHDRLRREFQSRRA